MKYSQLMAANQNGNPEAKRYIDFLRENTVSRSHNLAECGHQYEMEAVKHLAIINTAAIAASSALLAANIVPNKIDLLYALSYFIAGLVISVLVMTSASYLLYRSSRTIINNLNRFYKDEIESEEINPFGRIEKIWHSINIALSILALILFLCGTVECWILMPS
ncbi:hypothetical protein [Chromobacterium violaceum]|uniref:hypothetical protein n=1 Tax=Chromobacterium violaceum TaxID=536 RepID=UPI00195068B8|nr:hypothetical protein [Chromobacterium violaceum]QRO34136.1 hypothetical protein I6K04_05160 [Chromobacterium violaceum]QRQ16061.1 hypothetical protein I6K03_17570 [Chromobacterium violaceum]